MRFVSIRDFRNNASSVRASLEREHEIVLTANGQPFAILAQVDADDFEERLSALRRERARSLLRRIRGQAKASGSDQLSPEEIDAEISRARQERRRSR